ncbi:uncharacterized protein MYCGRDRAFT_81456 [Zymoseptoria tritici IPO323]|uniref:Uncharacterized protein n=1 Tax=Zymoseptoria tritici (strain CBS 115943 / IPO323) TaxID=336722 RepID=F9XF20_ZYMTI|nr:uncharacterized protein MYCGRDRAFT_81456 [Zymoseptoria tritici IPO323]EGP86212.1 hypothetical protein MYCGRDRAFT_81456 [Zymoseptoria tritici IPO323]
MTTLYPMRNLPFNLQNLARNSNPPSPLMCPNCGPMMPLQHPPSQTSLQMPQALSQTRIE